MVSRIAAGPVVVAGSFEQRPDLPFGCGDGSGGDAEQLGQDGPGYFKSLPHDGGQGFLGEAQCGGVASGGPAGGRAATGDVPAGIKLGLVGDGEGGGELVPAGGGHAGQGGVLPARALAPAGPGRTGWRRGRHLGAQGVVPVAVPVVARHGQRGYLLVADLRAGRVNSGVQLGADGEPGAGRGGCDARNDDLVAGQWPSPPVHGDVGEQPVLDLG